jgi:hypothetical protein
MPDPAIERKHTAALQDNSDVVRLGSFARTEPKLLIDTETADSQNKAQLEYQHDLRQPFHKMLDRLVRELPERFADLDTAMQPFIPAGLGLRVVKTTKLNDGAYDLSIEAFHHSGKLRIIDFRVQWAGKKEPACYEIYSPDYVPLRDGPKLIWHGIVDWDKLHVALAIYARGEQKPDTALYR